MVQEITALEQPAARARRWPLLRPAQGRSNGQQRARLRRGEHDPTGGEGDGRLDDAVPGQPAPSPVDLARAGRHARHGHGRAADHVVHGDVAEGHLDRHHRVGLHIVVEARHGAEEVETGDRRGGGVVVGGEAATADAGEDALGHATGEHGGHRGVGGRAAGGERTQANLSCRRMPGGNACRHRASPRSRIG